MKWDATGITDLNAKMQGILPSTVTATIAIAIDNAGQIVVEGTNAANGNTSTYLLTPSTVPLPADRHANVFSAAANLRQYPARGDQQRNCAFDDPLHARCKGADYGVCAVFGASDDIVHNDH